MDYYTRMSPVKSRRRGGKKTIIDDPKIGYDLHENDDISTEYEGIGIGINLSSS